MCVYCKAASAILDVLWESDDFRDFFYSLGYELAELGPLTHDVFVPAYLKIRHALQGGELEMLEAQVTEDIIGPLYDQPNFREAWEAWDQPTREEFVLEQSEMELGRLLVLVYDVQLDEAYRQAFLDYIDT
jgi:hypothetical protein